MILYYAVGGGLGHLTRAQAVIHSLGLADDLVLISASPYGDDPRIVRQARFIRVPEALASDMTVYREWLVDIIDALRPRVMFIDAFPCGLLGEFCDFPFPPELKLYHVARLLRWPSYRKRITGEPPSYELSFCVEQLTPNHLQLLCQCSSSVVTLELTDPPTTLWARDAAIVEDQLRGRSPVWLVVHSSPSWEVDRLCELALTNARNERHRPRLMLVAPRQPRVAHTQFTHLPIYPAEALFGRVDRLITGCGFNTMRQGKRSGTEHIFIPFRRALDDQHLRAERHRHQPVLASLSSW